MVAPALKRFIRCHLFSVPYVALTVVAAVVLAVVK